MGLFAGISSSKSDKILINSEDTENSFSVLYQLIF